MEGTVFLGIEVKATQFYMSAIISVEFLLQLQRCISSAHLSLYAYADFVKFYIQMLYLKRIAVACEPHFLRPTSGSYDSNSKIFATASSLIQRFTFNAVLSLFIYNLYHFHQMHNQY